MPATLEELTQSEYRLRLQVTRLRRLLYEHPDAFQWPSLLAELHQAENELAHVESERQQAQGQDPRSMGLIVDTLKLTGMLGSETTKLEAQIYLRLTHVPTGYVHLLDPQRDPLVTCRIRNADEKRIRRLRLTAYIAGYSAQAVDTVEIPPRESTIVHQLPVLFRDRLESLNELTRAMLNVLVEDLENHQVELHRALPIWLLARTAWPMTIADPMTAERKEMTPYLGAYVTPNAPAVMRFARQVAERHPQRQLPGYTSDKSDVEPQVRAVFQALKQDAQISYINSLLAFGPEDGLALQRVRLPSEALEQRSANCIDATLLFASLLEAISLSPALVIVPGHAFIGWETAPNSDEWRHLETTLIATGAFEQASQAAEMLVHSYTITGRSADMRRLPLRVLRGVHKITPVE